MTRVSRHSPAPRQSIEANQQCFDFMGEPCFREDPRYRLYSPLFVIRRQDVLAFGCERFNTSHQLHFEFMRRNNVIGIIPRHSYACLDYGIYDTFRTIPKLRSTALRIQKSGLYHLGELVQLTEEEARNRYDLSDDTVDAMKDHLAVASLRFNMRVPGWSSHRSNQWAR